MPTISPIIDVPPLQNPDQDLYLLTNKKAQIPNIVRKVSSVAAGVTGATSVAQAITSLIPEQVSQTASYVFTSTAAAVTGVLPTTIVNNMPTVAGTTAFFSSGYETVKNTYEYTKTAVSWGVWAMKVLPLPVQIGLGIGTVFIAYRIWTGGNQNNVTVNVNMHQPTSLSSANCQLITKQEGSTSTTTQICALPNTALTVDQCSPTESRMARHERLHHQLGQVANRFITVIQLRNRLKLLQDNYSKILFNPTSIKVESTLSALDTLIKNKFQGFSLQRDIKEVEIVIDYAQKEITDYTRNITQKMYKLGTKQEAITGI